MDAFKAGELEKDFVAVVRFQGPQAIGMPELHKMTPFLGVLQDRGFKVALVTDGRMSGASGKIPAAIHVSPEAYVGGRSEEHTSELQSLMRSSYAVFCLKNKNHMICRLNHEKNNK